MATRLDSIYRASLGRKLHHSNSNSYHRIYLRIFLIANWIRMQHLLHGACILPLSYKEDALCVGLMMASRVQRLFSGIWPLTSRRKTVLDGSVLHGADWQAESNASFIHRSLATLSAMTMVDDMSAFRNTLMYMGLLLVEIAFILQLYTINILISWVVPISQRRGIFTNAGIT